jgi:hypothetical protein
MAGERAQIREPPRFDVATGQSPDLDPEERSRLPSNSSAGRETRQGFCLERSSQVTNGAIGIPLAWGWQMLRHSLKGTYSFFSRGAQQQKAKVKMVASKTL